jgi:hypothetical protein
MRGFRREGHDVHRLGVARHQVLRDGDHHPVVGVRRQVERAGELLLLPVLVRLRLHDVLAVAGQRDLEVVLERAPLLHQVIVLHDEDAMLGEGDPLIEYRRIGEVEDHPALDAPVAGHLEQVAVREGRTGGRLQLEEAVHGTLGVPDGNRLRLNPPVALAGNCGPGDDCCRHDARHDHQGPGRAIAAPRDGRHRASSQWASALAGIPQRGWFRSWAAAGAGASAGAPAGRRASPP